MKFHQTAPLAARLGAMSGVMRIRLPRGHQLGGERDRLSRTDNAGNTVVTFDLMESGSYRGIGPRRTLTLSRQKA